MKQLKNIFCRKQQMQGQSNKVEDIDIQKKIYWKKVLGVGLLSTTIVGSLVATYITIDRSNIREITIDGTVVGYTKSEEVAAQIFEDAKKEVNENNNNTIQWNVSLALEKGKGTKVNSKEELKKSMEETLETLKEDQPQLSYVIKIDDYEVILKEKQEVEEVLEKTQEKYSDASNISVVLVKKDEKESLTPEINIVTKSGSEQDLVSSSNTTKTKSKNTEKKNNSQKDTKEQVVNVAFEEEITVEPVYVTQEKTSTVEQAVLDITKEKETNKTYEVQEGDTISEIANRNGMTVKEFLQLNKQIRDEDSIMPGDRVTISVPEPEVSVLVEKEETYEETYQAKTVYVENDSMYEGETKVVNKGKEGVREVVALVSYENGQAYKKQVIKKTVVKKAVAKTIERGTKVRPTFIKPISGGRLSSTFGQRWGRAHEGVDWACAIGTTIKASASGTVTQAGWINGYGYCVTISHTNGMSTRYGHMSKIGVSVGQKVSQGDKIGESGNTGRSTGPHLHFEIRSNGTPVNPLNYL